MGCHEYIIKVARVTTMSWYVFIALVITCILLFWNVSNNPYSYRLWICLDLVCGMCGITIHTRKFY